MIGPQAGFTGKANFRFTGSADLSCDVFLDHIQELKSDRIGLGEPRIWGGVNVDLVNPREVTCEIIFSEFLKDFPETIHEESQVIVNFLKTACDVILFHRATETGSK